MTNNIFLNVHDYKKSVPLSDNIKYLIIMSHPSESDTKYTIKTKNNELACSRRSDSGEQCEVKRSAKK